MSRHERYARVKDVFLAASRLPKGERTRFLTDQCADEPGLAEQVRALLTLEEQEPEFLETPALAAEGLRPGTRLGGFKVERLLGEGGMGVVYEARQDEPARRVALKIIRPGFLTARLRARFRHEIRVLGQLRHPGIAQIYEAGTLGHAGEEVPYFAMELIEGRPLLESAGPLGTRDRLALVAQICDAVHHAHQKGVIHRDLKPANILVEQAPTADSAATDTALPFQAKILDFGIARVTESDARTVSIHTDTGQLVGTIPYMSPEQISGQQDAVDIRTDVYSLGVMAFELLTGRLPYPVRERLLPEAARLIHEAEPTRLGSIDRSLRGDIETIIAKALEKDPGHRYQSAAEFAADIRRYLRDEPIVARPASALYQFRKFARRHRSIVAAAVLVLLAMVAATAVSSWQARLALRAKTLAETQRARADLSAASARREARRATLAATAAAVESGDPIAARRSLEHVPESDRGWAWKYWQSRLDNSIAVIPTPVRVAAACLVPRGDRIRILTTDGTLTESPIWDTSSALGPALAGAPVAAAAFIAGGDRIIAITGTEGRGLDEFNASDGSLIRHIADLPGRGSIVEASEDGAVIAVGLKTWRGTAIADHVWIWDHESPARDIRPEGRTTGLAVASDGRAIICGFNRGELLEAPFAEARTFADAPRGGLRFAIADNGSRIATGGEDKTIHLWGRSGQQTPIVIRGHAGNITALAFNPGATVLASAATDLSIRLWDAATGEPLETMMGHAGTIGDLRFSSDGSRLVSIAQDGTIRIWTRNPRESTCILRGHSSYIYSVAFTPDGKRIVSGAWDQTIRLWDAASGRALAATEPAGAGFVTALAVSPDGRRIASGHVNRKWTIVRFCIWDVDTLRLEDDIPFDGGEVHTLAFEPDDLRLWTCDQKFGAGWLDLNRTPPVAHRVVERQPTFSMALSPDGSRVAIGTDRGAVCIADAATGRTLREWTDHKGEVRALAWSPSGPILASAATDGNIRLRNPDTGELLARLNGHWDTVHCLAFSPDGKVLASGSGDTTIRIWDTGSGDELTRLRGHADYIHALAFSPDGTRLVSGSGDATVRVWDTRPVRERWAALTAARSP